LPIYDCDRLLCACRMVGRELVQMGVYWSYIIIILLRNSTFAEVKEISRRKRLKQKLHDVVAAVQLKKADRRWELKFILLLSLEHTFNANVSIYIHNSKIIIIIIHTVQSLVGNDKRHSLLVNWN
jgi:hypothetical protein